MSNWLLTLCAPSIRALRRQTSNQRSSMCSNQTAAPWQLWWELLYLAYQNAAKDSTSGAQWRVLGLVLRSQSSIEQGKRYSPQEVSAMWDGAKQLPTGVITMDYNGQVRRFPGPMNNGQIYKMMSEILGWQQATAPGAGPQGSPQAAQHGGTAPITPPLVLGPPFGF